MNFFRRLFARAGAAEAAPPWSLTTAVIAIAVLFAALIAGSLFALTWLGEQDFTLLAGLALGGVLVIIFIRQTREKQWDALRLAPSSIPVLFVIFFSVGLAILLDLLGLAVTREFLPKPELLGLAPGAMGVQQWLAAVIFMVIVQPIAEGLVFRGITLPALKQTLGAWGGLLATAVLAALFHFALYPPNYNTTSTLVPLWYGLLIPFVEAVCYSLVRSYTGSTRAAIAAQVAFGLFAVLKLLALSGQGV